MFPSNKHREKRRQSGRRPCLIHSIVHFPLLGPEPQNPFCVILSRRSYGKLRLENYWLLPTAHYELPTTSGSVRTLCSLPPSCACLRASCSRCRGSWRDP